MEQLACQCTSFPALMTHAGEWQASAHERDGISEDRPGPKLAGKRR